MMGEHIDIVNTRAWKKTGSQTGLRRSGRAGFSLMEILAVLVVIGVLAAVSAPSLLHISNSTGRKGAVNVMMNAFEQARVAALASGENAYVGFATELSFDPSSDYLYRAYIIFRTSTPEEISNGASAYTPLTKWEVLPKNIYFKKEAQTLIGDQASAPYPIDVQSSLPQVATGRMVPVIEFNSFGAVQNPTPTAANPSIGIYLSEHHYDLTSQQLAAGGNLLERISFSRFTGRAQYELSDISQP